MDMMDLDLAVNKHFHDGKSALAVRNKGIPDEKVTIPEYYDFWDVRMPVDEYVDRKFNSVLEEVFEGRLKVEKHLSRQELLAYDRMLSKYLKKSTIMNKIRREAYLDYNTLSQAGQELDQMGDSKDSEEMQQRKSKNQ